MFKLYMVLVYTFLKPYISKRRNYNIGPLSLPCVCNWSLKFQVSRISPSSFKIEFY